MSKVENINPEKHPVPAAWVPQVIPGGKGDEPPMPWLATLAQGTVFGCKTNAEEENVILFHVKYQFKRMTLLHSNINQEFNLLVDPRVFSKKYTLWEIVSVD